jgi:hypothetical protein
MSGNDKEAQQKRITGPRKHELSPLTFETDDQDSMMSEDDLLAEDDPMASSPPRPSSSAIRLNNPTNLTGARRAINTTTQQTPRASGSQIYPGTAIPPRRNGPAIAPLSGGAAARTTRSVTTPQDPTERDKQSRNIHWLLYVGVGMVAALALWVVGSWLLAWGSATYNNITYGNPRTFQIDAVVGHGGDSPQHPSHFIALNLNGQVIIIELRAGNPANSITYTGPHFYETGGNLIPVRLEFRDVNHDGKPDMLILFQDNVIVFLNDGTQFVPPK